MLFSYDESPVDLHLACFPYLWAILKSVVLIRDMTILGICILPRSIVKKGTHFEQFQDSLLLPVIFNWISDPHLAGSPKCGLCGPFFLNLYLKTGKVKLNLTHTSCSLRFTLQVVMKNNNQGFQNNFQLDL